MSAVLFSPRVKDSQSWVEDHDSNDTSTFDSGVPNSSVGKVATGGPKGH